MSDIPERRRRDVIVSHASVMEELRSLVERKIGGPLPDDVRFYSIRSDSPGAWAATITLDSIEFPEGSAPLFAERAKAGGELPSQDDERA